MIFETVAQLKLATLTAGQLVSTKGYYASGDGGAADYIVAATQAVDGYGDLALAGGTVAILQIGYSLNVRQYGLAGDSGDDTLPAQAMLTRMQDDQRSRIYFPNGIYLFSQKLTYTQPNVNNSLTIEGEDEIQTKLKWSNADGGIEAQLSVAAAQLTSSMTVKSISLITTAANGGAALRVTRGASAVVAPNTLFEDVYIYQESGGFWNYGIHTTDSSDTWFSRCYIMNFGDSTTASVFIDNNLTGQTVFGAYFSNCSFNGGTASIRSRGKLESCYITDSSLVGALNCVDFDATGTTSGNPHLSIKGCHINGKRTAINLLGWRAVLITGTDVYSGVGAGDVDGNNLYVNGATSLVVTGNKFEIGAPTLARSFIELVDTQDFSITGNVMNNASAAGIKMSGATGIGVISANTILGYADGTPNSEGIYNAGSLGSITYTANRIGYFAAGISNAAGSSANLITANIFDSMTTGIFSVGGSNNYAKGNTFVSVTTEVIGTLLKEVTTQHVVDPPSIIAGGRTTVLLTVPSASLGDFVSYAAPYDVQDLMITANVQNTNTVALYFYNPTAGAVDLPSGSWSVRVAN